MSILIALTLPVDVASLEPVLALAEATGAPVHLLHAVRPDAPDITEATAAASDRLNRLATDLRHRGLHVDTGATVGPAVDVILATSDAFDATLIAIVGDVHHIDNRPLLGSVTSTLLRVAYRPVLVLPALPMPMHRDDLPVAVDRLIDVIDREATTLVTANGVPELRAAASAHLAEPDAEDRRLDLRQRLTDTLEHFETDHPSLTRAINDVAYYLSGMGI